MRSFSWLVLAVPLAAAGQEVPGIDLSAPAPSPPPEEKAPAETPPAARKAEPRKASPIETAIGVPGEQDAALGDRVKAVQRKGFLKRGRLQLTALFTPTVNDAFFEKYGFGARLAYNLQDTLAVGVRGTVYASVETDYRKQGVRAFQSLLVASKIRDELMLEAIWSPIYGKVAVLERSIIHFDVFLLAGGGLVWSDTSVEPRSEGPHIAADFGGGVRFYPNDFLALEAGLRATVYPDQTDAALPATLQKAIVLSLGVSFFFPTRFEYVYP